MLTSDRLDKIEDLPKAKSRKSLVSKLREYASAHASLISFVILIAFLETIIAWREIPDYVIPAPHKILFALYAGFAVPLVRHRRAFTSTS